MTIQRVVMQTALRWMGELRQLSQQLRPFFSTQP